jgi:hypothetical protein
MSGIYGIYHHGGTPAERVLLERMRAAMAFYGPDGDGSLVEDSVGLGHLLQITNPEDAFEKQPYKGVVFPGIGSHIGQDGQLVGVVLGVDVFKFRMPPWTVGCRPGLGIGQDRQVGEALPRCFG